MKINEAFLLKQISIIDEIIKRNEANETDHSGRTWQHVEGDCSCRACFIASMLWLAK